ncbi:MAG: bifunctional 5,10-methylenetetrahydrofolate dehydrogenase/5,10-methenyltetrahydrofolate cyclohydrolase [Chloroflexi bacterium]|nr:bifunctional 5,10-methylenetetrahydrofolate dehydrogenase/5,10-methenyltetrahydrofolate cyclohydrolase [Chloroflexota bacterium]
MSALILDGRAAAARILDDVRARAALRAEAGKLCPTLAVVRVGDDPPSVRYARQLERTFRGAGLAVRLEVLPPTIDDDGLAALLRALSADASVHGILLQLPLPAHLSRERAAEEISPDKDVDGLTPLNAGRLFLGRGLPFAPATPLGGLELLHHYGIGIAGRHAVVVGRSDVLGRPLALLLLRENATVTICHSRTPDLPRLTRQAEILAVAVGRPGLVTGDMVAPGAVVLDFGINVVAGSVVGDVDFASVAPLAGAITPVPGGTGPMTAAVLARNTLTAAERQDGRAAP